MEQNELVEFTDNWQDAVDLMAQLINVPVGLIMRLNEEHLEVLVSSETDENPYIVGEKEVMSESGLYCETVINTNKKLKVPNALKDSHWEDNPDVALNMISYLGHPISWPNGEPFGTLCVLDREENHYSEKYERLILKFKNLIETHLEVIEQTRFLTKLSEIDFLTEILNRRAFFSKAELELQRSLRYQHPMSILLFDVDHFKKINDTYGHLAGDEVLKLLSKTVSEVLRTSDIFGRYGGEEFIVLLPETDYDSAILLATRIKQTLSDLTVIYDGNLIKATVSIGVSSLDKNTELTQLISQADKALYKAKNSGRNCVC